MGCGDKILWIQSKRRPIDNVLHGDWIHMVNHQPPMDLIARNTQVASVVPQNNDIANASPLERAIEPLVDPSVRTKSLCTNLAAKIEIVEAFFERWNTSQLSVGSNLHDLAFLQLGHTDTKS